MATELHAGEPAKPGRVLVIEAGKAQRHYWNDLWRFRELLYFLAWRDILVRYKQTALGISWAVIRPVLTMAVFTVVFGKLAHLPSGDVPYPILVFAALLPWQLFATGFAEAGNSLVSNANMISKVYFPRLIIPVSAIVVSLIDFFISLGILVVLMACYGYMPGWQIVALPLFVFMALALAVGTGLWVAALTVKFRDFRFIVPFIVQLGIYISPVGFSSSVVPADWRLLYSANPIVGVIDGFRWALQRGEPPLYAPGLFVSAALIALLLAMGIEYFRRMEKTFSDVI